MKLNIGKNLNKVYKEKYKDYNLDVKLINKKSSEPLTISMNVDSRRRVRIMHNEKGMFDILIGAYILNSTINDQEVIGKQYTINTSYEFGNISEEYMQNTNIYQDFNYILLILKNNEDVINIEIPNEFIGGLLTDLTVEQLIQDKELFERQQDLTDIQYYPIR